MDAEIGLGANSYGKSNVRFLRVVKDSPKHEVFELTGFTQLEGPFERAFTHADNSSILPTETQKNTFYSLSKKYPIDPIERWASFYARDILSRHQHIQAVNISLDRNPFERVVIDGQEHNHVFKKGSSGIRFVNARVPKNGRPTLSAGFRDLHVMKTTQSGFEGYIKDEYTTLPSTGDRILSTKIKCEWVFGDFDFDKTDFNGIYQTVMSVTLRVFAGNPKTGVYSPSVQQTIYDIGVEVLRTIKELKNISFELPNIHYYPVNFKEYNTSLTNNGEVFYTFDGAAGNIRATIERKPSSKL